MVMIGQQYSCLHPLVWIGRKLPAQPPRPVTGPKTSTVPYLGLERRQRPGLLASGRRPTNVVRPSSHFQTMKQRMRTSSDSSLERGGDKWGRRSRVAPLCQQWSHLQPLRHRGQVRETSIIKPQHLYWRWEKTRWNLPSTRSRGGRGDASLPHHSTNRSCKYLYL